MTPNNEAKVTESQLRDLLRRASERMHAINGDESNCCMPTDSCPNHTLMREIDAALAEGRPE